MLALGGLSWGMPAPLPPTLLLALGLTTGAAAQEIDSDEDGYTVSAGDCNDEDARVFPGAPEVCDGLDNDCNDDVDEVDCPHVGVCLKAPSPIPLPPRCRCDVGDPVSLLPLALVALVTVRRRSEIVADVARDLPKDVAERLE